MSRVDPYEALASLFLTDAAHGADLLDEGEPVDAVVTAASVEVALVGNLPVMGGLWLTQYADQIGRRQGPTALVRIERNQVAIELLRAPGARGGLETVETLDEALHVIAGSVRHWIICPQGEAALDGPFVGDALSLLTGSDDAATVAAYRIIKSLAERWHSAGWPVPPIGLIVLGATEDRVGLVAEKLDRTTKTFLDVDLDVTGHYQRMDAIESAGRRTFASADISVADACQRIRAANAQVRRDETPPPPRSAPVAPRSAPVAKLGPKGIVRERARPQTAERQREDAADAAAAMQATRQATKSASFAALIPGLDVLPARCPMHGAVELAVDASGGLNLVAPSEALASLRAVEAWAIAHAELLRLACPRLVAVERITSHVVTTDAPSIIPLHGSGLKLHLLVGTPAGWVYAALS